MKSMGNLKSNAHYNPDEIKNPPPTNMIESERDSELEKYIRAKYEYKSFVPRSAKVAALLGPSRSATTKLSSAAEPPRPKTVPAASPAATSSTSTAVTPAAQPATSTASSLASSALRTQSQIRSVSQPVPTLSSSSQHYSASQAQTAALQQQQQSQQQQTSSQSSNPVWNDLAQLQAPATNSSLPLQYASPINTQPISIPTTSTGLSAPNPYGGLSVSPNASFPSSFSQQQQGGAFAGGQPRSLSLNTGMSSLSMGVSGMGYNPGASPGMLGSSPSMLQPQPTFGGLSTPGSMLPQNTTPSPSPYTPQPLPPSGYGLTRQQQQQSQQQFAPSSFGQQQTFLQPQQTQGQFQPQGSPMFQPQQLQYGQSSPMFQPQPLGQGAMSVPAQMQGSMATGNPFLQPQPQQQQQQMQQPQFMPMGTPSPSPYGQQQQQQGMYGQGAGSAFGGTGWGQPQQQWGGM
ncbi:hypothetical protein PYCCODRAFT_1479087 [Trametes coccinea BRFM310]|uniref:Arf-GAP domain-containing protein n=1 Tax=Trametes coccinea (strain BRFM310) TaxID=1353009 RepID=A0A1Y2IHI7_TRAC3|nr:hypothetical protein PYCCODRAFT_1479087 [Trametes coccinea BRFM310]